MKNLKKIIDNIETTIIIIGFILGVLYFYVEYLVMKPFTKKTRKLEY